MRCASLLFWQSVQNDSQAIADVLNQLKDMLANFRGSEKYCYLQNEIFGLFQKLENINGVTDGYLNRWAQIIALKSSFCFQIFFCFPFWCRGGDWGGWGGEWGGWWNPVWLLSHWATSPTLSSLILAWLHLLYVLGFLELVPYRRPPSLSHRCNLLLFPE